GRGSVAFHGSGDRAMAGLPDARGRAVRDARPGAVYPQAFGQTDVSIRGMTWPFAILAVMTVASAIAAMCLRNLVHCALAVPVTRGGLAMLYLQLDAQFVGFAQVLVYIGAVAILIVFTILLTRGSEPSNQRIFSPGAFFGLGIAAVVFAILCW